MEILKSYLSLIDPHLLKYVRGKSGEFIRLLIEQNFETDEAFIRSVCGKNKSIGYYRNLKSRTLKTLQVLVVVSEPKGDDLVKKKYENCLKKFLIGQKILRKKQREAGIMILEEAYDLAVEYDFTQLACEISSILYYDLVLLEKKSKLSRRQAEQYAEAMDKYLYSYFAEKKAEKFFCNVVGQVTRSLNPQLVKKAIDDIILWDGTSIRYQVILATLQSTYGFHIANYELVISSCEKALNNLDGKKGVYHMQYFSFYKDIGVAQMAIGQYTAAEKNLEKASKYARSRSYNDYLIRFYKAMNALRAGNYQVAYQLYQQNNRCSNENIRLQFAIIEAYLHFMVYTGYLKLDKPFRIRKFLNDTFKGQADKRGDNISIVIAELLMYLAKDRGKFIDRVDAVKNYSYRYLKGEDLQRAKWFIRILCMLPRANFHPIALARLAKKQIENLEDDALSVGQNFAIEIIPFGDLLRMIMRQLEKKVA